MKRVHLSRRKHSRIAHCETLAVVQGCRCRRLARKLRRSPEIVFLEIAAPEKRMTAIRCQIVVDARNVSIESSLLVGREPESCRVETISYGRIVWQRITLQN